MPKRPGFTLVEFTYLSLIVVVLAAISVPVYRTLVVHDVDSSAKETLQLVRDAICIYSAEHDGSFPGADGAATTFKRQIEEELNSRFPSCPVGSGSARGVAMVDDQEAIRGEAEPMNAWKYNYVTGRLIINSREPLVNDQSTTYDQL